MLLCEEWSTIKDFPKLFGRSHSFRNINHNYNPLWWVPWPDYRWICKLYDPKTILSLNPWSTFAHFKKALSFHTFFSSQQTRHSYNSIISFILNTTSTIFFNFQQYLRRICSALFAPLINPLYPKTNKNFPNRFNSFLLLPGAPEFPKILHRQKRNVRAQTHAPKNKIIINHRRLAR